MYLCSAIILGTFVEKVFKFDIRIYSNCPVDCNTTVIDRMDLTPWIDSEAKLKLPITKETLEKAVRLGTDHAFRLQQDENTRIIRQR